MEKFKPGGFLGAQTFLLDDKWLKFSGAYTGHFNVPRSQIETVSVSPVNAGASELQLIGKGTILAKVELPHSWAEKSQIWIMEKLNLL